MRRLSIGDAAIEILDQYVITRFDDGEVVAAVNTTDEDIGRAKSLGYGDDLFAMCVDHEIGHSLLAKLLGLRRSPVLDAVAKGEPLTEEDAFAEEAAVLGLQRFARESGTSLLAIASQDAS